MAAMIPRLNNFTDIWKAAPDTYAQAMSRGKWKPYKHLIYASEIIRKAIINGNGRIVISMPPRHGKTELVGNWLPTWVLDRWPESRIILTSYGESLARTSGRKVRNNLLDQIESEFILRKDSQAATEFDTTEGGGLFATGMGGSITGRGADLLVIDDPLKTLKEAMSETVRQSHIDWFNSVAYTRLEPGGTIIVCQTRWHEKDLAGWLLSDHEDSWQLINLPAISEENDPLGRITGEALCPQRFDINKLQQIRKSIGERFWVSLYQGHPAPQEGAIWKKQWWKRWVVLPEKFDKVIQSWDTTIKQEGTSYVVGQVWGRVGASRYLLDQVRGRWGFGETKVKVRQLSAKWPTATKIVIEGKATGPALKDQLDQEISGIVLYEPTESKEIRAMACEPEIEAGNVFLPADEVMYPWVVQFIEESAIFPNGEDDDMVDAASQALSDLRESIAPFILEKGNKANKYSDKLRKGILR